MRYSLINMKSRMIVLFTLVEWMNSFTHKYGYDHSGHFTRIERLYDHGESDAIMIGWKDDKVVNMKMM